MSKLIISIETAEKNYVEFKSELQQKKSLIQAPQVNNHSDEFSTLTKLGMAVAVIGIISSIFVVGTVAKIVSGIISVIIIFVLLMTYKEPIQNKIEPPVENILHITEEVERFKDDINNYNSELKSLRLKYEENEENKATLDELKLKQSEELKKYEHLIKAREKLLLAKKNITSEYSKPLSKSFIKYYKSLANEDQKFFEIDDNLNLKINELNGHRDINTQSSGYKDLMWLCLRFALIDAMYPDEKPMLIMDDPFINLDDDKVAKGMNLLKRIAEDYQIIYFTCSDSRS